MNWWGKVSDSNCNFKRRRSQTSRF